jgi:Sec-independent protein translocase protein TatA
MSFLNPIHIAFFVAIALAVLGPKRFPEFTRALGNGMREFRDVINGASLRPDLAPETVTAVEPAAAPAVPAQPPAPGANTTASD